MILPLYKSSYVEITRLNDYTMPISGYCIQGYRLVNIDSSTELYTADDYAALEEAYEAGRN
jgi:hypothetical protein